MCLSPRVGVTGRARICLPHFVQWEAGCSSYRWSFSKHRKWVQMPFPGLMLVTTEIQEKFMVGCRRPSHPLADSSPYFLQKL